jgi:hypothetical protein
MFRGSVSAVKPVTRFLKKFYLAGVDYLRRICDWSGDRNF